MIFDNIQTRQRLLVYRLRGYKLQTLADIFNAKQHQIRKVLAEHGEMRKYTYNKNSRTRTNKCHYCFNDMSKKDSGVMCQTCYDSKFSGKPNRGNGGNPKGNPGSQRRKDGKCKGCDIKSETEYCGRCKEEML